MLDLIKDQFKSRRILSKYNFYTYHIDPQVNDMVGDMFPHWNDYYHELNPAFLFNVTRTELLDAFPAITVRDGSAIMGAFILKNFQTIGAMKSHFIISKNQARLVPGNLRHKFSCWSVYQHQRTPIEEARRVLIAGIVSDDALIPANEIVSRLECLKQIPDKAAIDVFLPQRRNVLSKTWRENYRHYEIIEFIKELIPGKRFNYITTTDLIGNANYNGTYYIDLMSDLAVADSYLSHFIANRGGTVAEFDKKPDPDAYFELDLSFTHKVQFMPLPECESLFAEMVFYKKQTASKDFYSDPHFHNLIRTK